MGEKDDGCVCGGQLLSVSTSAVAPICLYLSSCSHLSNVACVPIRVFASDAPTCLALDWSTMHSLLTLDGAAMQCHRTLVVCRQGSCCLGREGRKQGGREGGRESVNAALLCVRERERERERKREMQRH
eukprot:951387-Rhodomonas_salina.1